MLRPVALNGLRPVQAHSRDALGERGVVALLESIGIWVGLKCVQGGAGVVRFGF